MKLRQGGRDLGWTLAGAIAWSFIIAWAEATARLFSIQELLNVHPLLWRAAIDVVIEYCDGRLFGGRCFRAVFPEHGDASFRLIFVGCFVEKDHLESLIGGARE